MAGNQNDHAPPTRRRRERPVVAISATYGAGGAFIGERVAAELGVPFLPHMFTSQQMDAARKQRLAEESAEPYLLHRVRGDEAQDDRTAEAVVTELASKGALEESDEEVQALARNGGVVVGRAGPYVLREESQILHVLLDGPREERIRAGAVDEGIDEQTAADRQIAHDESRISIARLHYGVDPNDLRFYAVILDTTVLGVDTAAAMIITAARGMQEA